MLHIIVVGQHNTRKVVSNLDTQRTVEKTAIDIGLYGTDRRQTCRSGCLELLPSDLTSACTESHVTHINAHVSLTSTTRIPRQQ